MVTVEELLKQQNISFQPKGADFIIRCLNPEHEDKNPSMRIDQLTGIFNCFSCSFKGNIFYYFGEKPNQLQLRREKLKRSIEAKRAESIGLAFPSNYSDYVGNWRGISKETYKQFEAFEHHGSEFIGRIVFPIRDSRNKIKAFIGRHTSQGVPKYYIYPSKAKLPLYPNVEPFHGHIMLVEGIFDLLNLWDNGIKHAICCFGIKNINEDRLKILKMKGVDTVDIFLDGDKPGQDAAMEIQRLCNRVDLQSRNIALKDDQDPGSLTKNQIEKLTGRLYGKYCDSRS